MPRTLCHQTFIEQTMTHFKVASMRFSFTALLPTSEAQTSCKMQINQKAPVKQANQILINASPEQVWAVLTDINNWVSWNEKIIRADLVENLTLGAKFSWKVNGANIQSTLHTVKPNTTFGWSGSTFGGSAIHNWYLEPHDGGTLVKVEESMEGWLVSLFKTKMNKALEQDMQYWLEALKRESEKR
jgi:uncharacterized protein YndB with AHSA1/START domain